MKNKYKNIIYLVLVIIFVMAVFFLSGNEAQATSGAVTSEVTDPCDATIGSPPHCDPADASIGIDTVTFVYELTGANDEIDHTFELYYGASTVADTDDASGGTKVPSEACGGGSPIVLGAMDNSNVVNSPACGVIATWDSTNIYVNWDTNTTQCTVGDKVTMTWEIEFCSQAGGNTYDIDSLCAKSGGVASCNTIEYLDEWGVIGAAVATLKQAAYKWFKNLNSTAVGRGATINSAVTAPEQGTPFRLRLLFHVGSANLAINGTSTRLEYAVRSGECDTGFVGENGNWNEVFLSSGDIRFYDNNDAGATNGAALTPSIFDPRHTTTSLDADVCAVINQDYQEYNDATNTEAAILEDQDGLWDYSLVDYSAPSDTTYCFRAVQKGGGVLTGGYAVVPEITTAQKMKVRLRGTIRLRVVRLF